MPALIDRVQEKRSVAMPKQQYIVLLQNVNKLTEGGQNRLDLRRERVVLVMLYFSLPLG